jgi:hypothetical protein
MSIAAFELPPCSPALVGSERVLTIMSALRNRRRDGDI